MEDKYYTPEVEEFYVGFEYEEDCGWDDEWTKKTLDFEHGWIEVSETFAENKRVKYLDSKDIEELGFESTYVLHIDSEELIDGFELKLNKQDRIIIHLLDKNTFAIYKSHCYNEISGNWEQIDLFRGTIKNKSEFKMILKMLNIIE